MYTESTNNLSYLCTNLINVYRIERKILAIYALTLLMYTESTENPSYLYTNLINVYRIDEKS